MVVKFCKVIRRKTKIYKSITGLYTYTVVHDLRYQLLDFRERVLRYGSGINIALILKCLSLLKRVTNDTLLLNLREMFEPMTRSVDNPFELV